MLWLRTLGGTHVANRDDGSPLGGAAGQRRLLALLSLLAVAGDTGLSRDRILALLWPDGDPEKSRHALTQTLYHARKTLRCDDLFIADAGIRLNPARMSSDVRELEVALRCGEVECAAELYAGPFLDGFVLPGAGEFERWVSEQRRHLATRMAKAFERLAAEAETRGYLEDAAAWRKRGFALDPLSSVSAFNLIRTLAASGDRTSALHHAHVHEMLLREQLELEPDAAIRDFVAQLRSALPSAPIADGGSPNAEVMAEEPTPLPGSHAPTPESPSLSSGDDDRSELPRRARRWTRRIAIAAACVAVGFGLAAALFARGELPAKAAPPMQSIVVAPFRVDGADPSLGYLRDGLVELLAVRLGEDSSSHVIDAGRVLSAWRSLRSTVASRSSRDRAVDIARRLTATHVVVGSLVGNASRIVLTAALVAASNDSVLARATVDGPGDSLTTLVSRLASKLIVASAGEDDRFTDRTTPSPSALRAWLEGQSAYRRGDYSLAIPFYERAVKLDSSFALAAMHLALAADQVNDAEQHDRALALAWANREDLNAQDRVHLIAFAGPRYPSPSPEAEQLAAWERAVSSAPDRAEVWLELGERLFHEGAVLGLRDGNQRAAAAFRRALELDPTHIPSRRSLILVAARIGDTILLRKLAPAATHDSLGLLSPALRWRAALALTDEYELRRVRASMTELDDENLRLIGMASQFDANGVDDGERALRIRTRRTDVPDRVDALLGAHSLALNQGRPVLALDITEQLQELKPGLRAHLRLRVLDALYGDGDTTAARQAAVTLAQYADNHLSASPDVRALQLADLCVLEQWRLARGVTRTTPNTVSLLRRAPIPRTAIPVSANQLACAEILETGWSVATRQPDALARVIRLDSLMLSGPAVSDAGTYSQLVVSRLYSRLQQPARALEAIRNRTYMVGWPRYLATTRREEAHLALVVGDTAGALQSYRRYLALRSTPEPPLGKRDDVVRAELATLQRLQAENH